jgi:AraC-like DNA-binding protein
MPPHTYLTHLRIQRAKQLLAKGMRASEVASTVGLYDQSQLTRHFRRIVGTTPARYACVRGKRVDPDGNCLMQAR